MHIIEPFLQTKLSLSPFHGSSSTINLLCANSLLIPYWHNWTTLSDRHQIAAVTLNCWAAHSGNVRSIFVCSKDRFRIRKALEIDRPLNAPYIHISLHRFRTNKLYIYEERSLSVGRTRTMMAFNCITPKELSNVCVSVFLWSAREVVMPWKCDSNSLVKVKWWWRNKWCQDDTLGATAKDMSEWENMFWEDCIWVSCT